MGLFCKNCGSTDEFEQEQWGSCTYWQRVVIDCDGQEQDTLEGPDCDDYEPNNSDNTTCRACGSTNIGDTDNGDNPEDYPVDDTPIDTPISSSEPIDWKERFQK